MLQDTVNLRSYYTSNAVTLAGRHMTLLIFIKIVRIAVRRYTLSQGIRFKMLLRLEETE